MIVRSAIPEDIERVLELGRQMHLEGAYAFLPFDRDKVTNLLNEYMDHPQTRFLMVAERDDIVVGMLAGFLSDYFFCEEKIACDTILYVERKYRGGSAAGRLIKAFSRWAKERDARELCLGISTAVDTERIGQFYRLLGFEQMGGVYKQRLK